EQSLERLEEIVEDMEKNEMSLDESVKLYKEGIELYKQCAENLGKLEQEVIMLKKTAEGDFEEEEFDDMESGEL
ncbi:MAG: exodeoxyribonuclease VII small subunit, partial [Firmicutes bacterium]|nr:exodeoxyribonuclease VII small subunit [Bacillota bacterium]